MQNDPFGSVSVRLNNGQDYRFVCIGYHTLKVVEISR